MPPLAKLGDDHGRDRDFRPTTARSLASATAGPRRSSRDGCTGERRRGRRPQASAAIWYGPSRAPGTSIMTVSTGESRGLRRACRRCGTARAAGRSSHPRGRGSGPQPPGGASGRSILRRGRTRSRCRSRAAHTRADAGLPWPGRPVMSDGPRREPGGSATGGWILPRTRAHVGVCPSASVGCSVTRLATTSRPFPAGPERDDTTPASRNAGILIGGRCMMRCLARRLLCLVTAPLLCEVERRWMPETYRLARGVTSDRIPPASRCRRARARWRWQSAFRRGAG
jgi:hypothetical protein